MDAITEPETSAAIFGELDFASEVKIQNVTLWISKKVVRVEHALFDKDPGKLLSIKEHEVLQSLFSDQY